MLRLQAEGPGTKLIIESEESRVVAEINTAESRDVSVHGTGVDVVVGLGVDVVVGLGVNVAWVAQVAIRVGLADGR